MRRRITASVAMLRTILAIAGVVSLPLMAQDEMPILGDAPRPSVGVERTGVHLVLVDVVVTDRNGRPVGDLGADDFEVLVDGTLRTVDTVDVACLEVDASSDALTADAMPGATRGDDSARTIVVALDYQHLPLVRRARVLETLRDELPEIVEPGDRLMVAALTGGLRIEQGFTADLDEVLATLDRMAHDISLWRPDFRHLSEGGFTGGMTALLDIVAQEPGSKAIVLYSEMQDVPLDHEFDRLAAHAATARCAIYPVDAAGLLTPIDEERQRGARPG